MVYENKIPIEVNKKPFETVCEIKNEIPSFEEFMKDYRVDDNLNYDDLSVGNISEVKGYGPCYRGCSWQNPDCTHYIGEGYIPLHLACPGEGCIGGTPYLWKHSEPCGGHMYISEDAYLKCMKSGCGEYGYITEWSFKCWRHKGEKPYYSTNNSNCIGAMSTVLNLYPNKSDAIKRVIGKIIREITRREGY